MIENKNQMAFIQLKLLGFDPVKIRKCFHKLTGITNLQMADKIGVKPHAINHTEKGIRNNPDLQRQIADIYGIPVEEFFYDTYKNFDYYEYAGINEPTTDIKSTV